MAVTITWTDVTDVAAELSTVPVAAQTKLLAYVNAGRDGFADDATVTLIRAYKAAHMATLAIQAGKGVVGPAGAKSSGDHSISYVNPGSFGHSWKSTHYGQMYSSLVRSTQLIAPTTTKK